MRPPACTPIATSASSCWPTPSVRARKLLHAVSPLVIAAIGAVMAYWGAVLLLDGLGIKIAGASMPQSIAYLPLSLGGALMVVFALYRLLLVLRAPTTDEAR